MDGFADGDVSAWGKVTRKETIEILRRVGYNFALAIGWGFSGPSGRQRRSRDGGVMRRRWVLMALDRIPGPELTRRDGT